MTNQLRSVASLIAAGVLLALIPLSALAGSATIKVGVNKAMDAYLMTPDGPGPYPAVLVLHTSGGLQSEDLAFARRLAGEGYVALVPAFLDAYGIRSQTRQAAFTNDAEPIYADFVEALNQLRNNPKVDGGRLAAIGFSNGGYFALWLAATGKVQAGVSYYGALTGAGTDPSLERFRQTFNIQSSPVLILHGASDSTVPIDKAIKLDSALTAAQAPHAFHQYPGAGHRFDREGGADNEVAAADAWRQTLDFLSATLRK